MTNRKAVFSQYCVLHRTSNEKGGHGSFESPPITTVLHCTQIQMLLHLGTVVGIVSVSSAYRFYPHSTRLSRLYPGQRLNRFQQKRRRIRELPDHRSSLMDRYSSSTQGRYRRPAGIVTQRVYADSFHDDALLGIQRTGPVVLFGTPHCPAPHAPQALLPHAPPRSGALVAQQ